MLAKIQVANISIGVFCHPVLLHLCSLLRQETDTLILLLLYLQLLFLIIDVFLPLCPARCQQSEEEAEAAADTQLGHGDEAGEHKPAGSHQAGQEAAGSSGSRQEQSYSQRQEDQVCSGSVCSSQHSTSLTRAV